MEKKNPYVMTIGFRRNNADHTRVAEFLNSLGREKAQYIVKAVLTYRTLEEKGEVPQTGGAVSYDYETIKSIVLQIMRPAIELLKRINPDFTPCDNGAYRKTLQTSYSV